MVFKLALAASVPLPGNLSFPVPATCLFPYLPLYYCCLLFLPANAMPPRGGWNFNVLGTFGARYAATRWLVGGADLPHSRGGPLGLVFSCRLLLPGKFLYHANECALSMVVLLLTDLSCQRKISCGRGKINLESRRDSSCGSSPVLVKLVNTANA